MWSANRTSSHGYGFIASLGDKRDYYFTNEDIIECLYPDLRTGISVEFVPVYEGNNRLAKQVRLLDKVGVDYYQYIRSKEWKEKADSAKQRADYKCQVCNASADSITLDTHHRTYERLGSELPGDIIVLCRECHQLYETNKKSPKPKTPEVSHADSHENSHKTIPNTIEQSAPKLHRTIPDIVEQSAPKLHVTIPDIVEQSTSRARETSDNQMAPRSLHVKSYAVVPPVHNNQSSKVSFDLVQNKTKNIPDSRLKNWVILISILSVMIFVFMNFAPISSKRSQMLSIWADTNESVEPSDSNTSQMPLLQSGTDIPTTDASTDSNTSISTQNNTITQEIYRVIQKWDSVHHIADRTLDKSILPSVLMGKALQEQQESLQILETSGCYWIFLDIEAPEILELSEVSTHEVTAKVRKHWDGQLFCNGKIDLDQSYNTPFIVYYRLLLTDSWRIAEKLNSERKLKLCEKSGFDSIQGKCKSSERVFTSGIAKIYVSWEVIDGQRPSSYTRKWYFEGNSVPFLVEEDDSQFGFWEASTTGGLRLGSYRIELYDENILIGQTSFTVN